MRKLVLLSSAVCCAMLVGCASVPMTSASQDTAAKRFQPEPGKANIYVNRGGGLGTAQTVQILLDGRAVGSLAPYTFQLLSVAPGAHVLSTGAGMENVEEQKVEAKAGENYFFRVSLAMGWALPRVHLRPLGQQEGKAAVMNSHRAMATVY